MLAGIFFLVAALVLQILVCAVVVVLGKALIVVIGFSLAALCPCFGHRTDPFLGVCEHWLVFSRQRVESQLNRLIVEIGQLIQLKQTGVWSYCYRVEQSGDFACSPASAS